jgi:surfeit locus 1 family protein
VKYAVLFVAIPVAALCVRLGFWQVSRLHQRRARNEEVRAMLAQPAVDLPATSGDLPAYRRVKATGRFDYDHQVIIEDIGFEGTPAVVVVTPLRLSDSTAVLVERGWVPSPDPRRVSLDSIREGDSTTVEGVVAERTSPRFVASSYPHRLRPFVLRRTNVPPAGLSKRALRPVLLPELTDGPHLSYAIQWFSFAIIAIVGSIFLYRKERARRDSY